MTDNIQIIENNDLNTLNKEILKFTILVTHFETQPRSRDHNEGYNVPLRLSPPVKETLI